MVGKEARATFAKHKNQQSYLFRSPVEVGESQGKGESYLSKREREREREGGIRAEVWEERSGLHRERGRVPGRRGKASKRNLEVGGSMSG